MARVWWVRHGPTHAKTMVGWTDLPADLSDTAALSRLDALLPAHAPIVSSDLLRAVHTADSLQGKRHRLGHEPDLREIHFGAWENRTFDDVNAETPAELEAFWSNPGTTRAPGGESWNALTDRVSASVEGLVKNCGDDLIIVAHFGAILSQLALARGETPSQAFAQYIDPLSVTCIDLANPGTLPWVNHRP